MTTAAPIMMYFLLIMLITGQPSLERRNCGGAARVEIAIKGNDVGRLSHHRRLIFSDGGNRHGAFLEGAGSVGHII
jgi:hypothetical protein